MNNIFHKLLMPVFIHSVPKCSFGANQVPQSDSLSLTPDVTGMNSLFVISCQIDSFSLPNVWQAETKK
ncbi:hypothetical protein THO17_20150 [Marinomonas sp. THO17]